MMNKKVDTCIGGG